MTRASSLMLMMLMMMRVCVSCRRSYCEAPRERRVLARRFRRGERVKRAVESAAGAFAAPGYLERVKKECDLVSKEESGELNWTPYGAIFFLSTVVTTVGYGTYCPGTTAGRLITCLAAFFGLAWFGYILTLTAERGECFVVLCSRLCWRSRVVVDWCLRVAIESVLEIITGHVLECVGKSIRHESGT